MYGIQSQERRYHYSGIAVPVCWNGGAIPAGIFTCFIWYLFATAGYHLDTLLDTLEEGRLFFLEISMFPDLSKSSNPPLSANINLGIWLSEIVTARLQ